MYRVLVPIDENEQRAASQARTVAALPTAAENIEATLVHVFDDRDTAETTSVRHLPSGKRATEVLVEAGVPVTTESANGDPADVILAAAERTNADHIVMGGRKHGRMGAILFDSVSRQVSNGTDLPVTIAGDAARGKPSHVCETCGERFYTDDAVEECPICGGVQVGPPAA